MSIKWRSHLAKVYIKWGNKFPFLKGDLARTLRHIQKRQIEDTESTFKETRPPEGVEMEYIYFRLFDTFQVEDVDSLLQGLKKLFPNFNDPFFRGDYYEKFIQNAIGIGDGQWLNIGDIARDKKGRFWGDRFRVLRSLPSTVEYIHIELHKILPSLFVLTYDVYLERSVTEKLNELQNSHYVSNIYFRKIMPYGKGGGGYSIESAEFVMRQNIEKWRTDLYLQIEKCLGGFLKGEFLRNKLSNSNELPSVEVYSFKGIPKTKNALQKWLHKSSSWLESLGFHMTSFYSYTNGKLIFIPKLNFNKDNDRSSHRVIVLREQYLKSINEDMYGHDEKFAIAHTTQEGFLTPILVPLVMYEILARFRDEFEKTRRSVLQTMRPTSFYSDYFGTYIKLNDIVLHASVLYDRISKDFHSTKKHVASELKKVSDFFEIEKNRKGDPQSLDQDLLAGVEFRITLLKEHVDFAMTWLSQYLALRNLSVTYFLAVVAGISAIISLILSLK